MRGFMMGNRGHKHTNEVARGYSRFQRWLNYLGLATWLVLLALTVHQLSAIRVSGMLWISAVAVLVALPIADFATGFVHWAADNIGREDWPVVGGFVKPFRNHHVDPEDMVHHRFWEMHGDHFIATLPCFWFMTLLDAGPAGTFFWKVMWSAVAVFVIATAKFHAWAHSPAPPALVRWLQRRRVILSPQHHARHHTPPYNRNYCITNGWMNGPLRWLRFFEFCEWLMMVSTGTVPLTRQPSAHPTGEDGDGHGEVAGRHEDTQPDRTTA